MFLIMSPTLSHVSLWLPSKWMQVSVHNYSHLCLFGVSGLINKRRMAQLIVPLHKMECRRGNQAALLRITCHTNVSVLSDDVLTSESLPLHLCNLGGIKTLLSVDNICVSGANYSLFLREGCQN